MGEAVSGEGAGAGAGGGEGEGEGFPMRRSRKCTRPSFCRHVYTIYIPGPARPR